MINLLIGNKNIEETNILCQSIANDKNYMIEITNTANETLSAYMKKQHNILVLDSNLDDMPLENIMQKLSCSPIESKKCNIVLTVPQNYSLVLDDVAKINKVLRKPISNDNFACTIQTLSKYFYVTDLENGEIERILNILNISLFSDGYNYLKEAIVYCYYNPSKLEFLSDVLEYISFKFSLSKDKVRESMRTSLKSFNNSTSYLNKTSGLYKMMYENTGKLSLKKFLEKIVLYFIQKNGRPL